MIETFSLLLNQVSIMLVLMIIGYILTKKEMIDADFTKKLSTFLLCITNPAVMIKSFNIEFDIETLTTLALAFAICLLLHLVMIIIAKLCFSKSRLSAFALIFTNSGFMGIPLVEAFLGDSAIIYMTVFMVTSTLFMWTYGIYLISGDRNDISFSKVIKNPATIALFVGLILFILPIELPVIFKDSLEMLTSCNTPLAMIVLGSYLASRHLNTIFKDVEAYKISIFRLIIIPLITLAILSLLPSSLSLMRSALLIGMSAPVAIAMSMFEDMLGKKGTLSVDVISLSTIFSLFSIPLVVAISSILWI